MREMMHGHVRDCVHCYRVLVACQFMLLVHVGVACNVQFGPFFFSDFRGVFFAVSGGFNYFGFLAFVLLPSFRVPRVGKDAVSLKPGPRTGV